MKVYNDMASRGRIGGFVRASRYLPEDLTRAARAGFLRTFEPQDPNLSPEERRRRGQAALKAHMARLARLSALARRGKR
jgi:hypothetical protein